MESLFCLFRGHTAIQGSAKRMPDGLYCPTVRIIRKAGETRAESTHEIHERRFKTYSEAAQFGIAYAALMLPEATHRYPAGGAPGVLDGSRYKLRMDAARAMLALAEKQSPGVNMELPAPRESVLQRLRLDRPPPSEVR